MDSIEKYKFIAKAAKALGDYHRMQIFCEIVDRGSLPLLGIPQLIKLAQPSVQFHVKQLLNAGIVYAEKQGREVHLKINHETADQFFSHLDQIKDSLHHPPAK